MINQNNQRVLYGVTHRISHVVFASYVTVREAPLLSQRTVVKIMASLRSVLQQNLHLDHEISKYTVRFAPQKFNQLFKK